MSQTFDQFILAIKEYGPDQWSTSVATQIINRFSKGPEPIIQTVTGSNYNAVVVSSLAEAQSLIPYLGNLVGLKALVHVPSALVKDYGRAKRNILAPYKAHNEKMGANWSVADLEYKIEAAPGNHFTTSGYKSLIKKANEQLNYGLPVHNYNLPVPQQPLIKPDMAVKAKRELKGLDPEVDHLRKKVDDLTREIEYRMEEERRSRDDAGAFNKSFKNALVEMSTGLLQTAERFRDNDIRKYAIAHTDAFSPAANGCRIPTLSAPPTVTSNDYQSIRFSAVNNTALIVINYNALRMSPVVVLQPPAGSNLTLDASAQGLVSIDYKDTVNNEIFSRPTRTGSLGVPFNQLLANSSVGQQLPNLSDFSQIRLVAGGFKLWKTSRQENESGVIQALYAPSGMSLDQSIEAEVDRRNGTHHHIKVYPAALSGECGGRAGFLLGGQYRPNDEGRYTRFSQSTDLFLKTSEGPDNESYITQTKPDEYVYVPNQPIGDEYYGPLKWFHGTAHVYDLPNQGALATGLASFGTRELRMPHTTLVVLQGLQPGSSYELELKRHFEGIPTADNNSREMRFVPLPMEYATPLQILHRAELRDHIISPAEYYMQRGIYLRGLWDLPVLRNVKDVINLGLDKISENPEVVDLLKQVLPKATAMLARSIPITADFSGEIENAVERSLQQTLKSNGYRLKGIPYDEDEYEEHKCQAQPRVIQYLNSVPQHQADLVDQIVPIHEIRETLAQPQTNTSSNYNQAEVK